MFGSNYKSYLLWKVYLQERQQQHEQQQKHKVPYALKYGSVIISLCYPKQSD